ncbi:uncharacterized protein LOC107027611 [Solanum pennellii]|uniref:Uncharacterized protein LOC107027611 n=1 Tax=Solanum pennellii TaxID=28526 RepID=A0ABM1HE61_SOLPN|nr:uncharacterized protein LOC107027611 [Solanum pennellii]
MALDISGNNYLSWVLDVEIHLDTKGLGATITNGNTVSSQDKAKAMIFLRHHMDEGLKVEYLTMKDPLGFWTGFKERGFKKYSELISCLLVAEQHNTLLLKKHEARPMGTAPLTEANKVEAQDQFERRQNKNQGQNNVRVDVAMADDDIIIIVVVVATKGRTIWVLKAILQEAIVIVVA